MVKKAVGGAAKAEAKALKPSQCRNHMRKTLAEEFRGITKGFVAGAKKGSCQHVKLAVEFLEPPAKRTRREGTAARLLRELGG